MFVFVLFKNGCLFGLLVVDIYFLKKLFKRWGNLFFGNWFKVESLDSLNEN